MGGRKVFIPCALLSFALLGSNTGSKLPVLGHEQVTRVATYPSALGCVFSIISINSTLNAFSSTTARRSNGIFTYGTESCAYHS